MKPADRCWIAALDWDAEEIDDENWYFYLSLPYWLVVAGYATVWLGGVMLWQLRKARLSLKGELDKG
ncbi:hypothetical protein [Luteolibacter rhizosphaerae]|uniref:hypothetical protein n=1 Tax=Luteolibacter rhizosphaerae TaxID=2989719 RepID=UPI00222218F7|nr:hypothetical protein [Luteolibacter rhizosphaerae]